jgi:hypothetical protein
MNFAATTFCPTKPPVRSIVVVALHPFSPPRSPQTSSSTAGVRSFTLKILASSFCTRVGIHLRDRAVPELPCDDDRGDGGRREAALTVESEPGEHSSPAIIQTPDGLVHITYTWNRQRVRHSVIDPAQLSTRSIEGGVWP